MPAQGPMNVPMDCRHSRLAGKTSPETCRGTRWPSSTPEKGRLARRGWRTSLSPAEVGRPTVPLPGSLPTTGHSKPTTQQPSTLGFISNNQHGPWEQCMLSPATGETPLADMIPGSPRTRTTWSSLAIQAAGRPGTAHCSARHSSSGWKTD